MTIVSISNKIFDFFSENEIFHLKDDLISVTDVNVLPKDVIIEMVKEAFKPFEEQKIATKIVISGANGVNDIFWVLNKPLADYEQSITISSPTIKAIAHTVNSILDSMDIKEGHVNPLNISEKDIQTLTLLLANNSSDKD